MPRLMRPEIREYAVRCYLDRGFSPSEVVDELGRKFDVKYRPAQIRQFLSRGGFSAKRRVVDRQVSQIVSEAAVSEIARTRAAKPEELLQEWARQLVAVAQKSLDAAARSERVRDMASATAAAATAIRTFRSCTGLDPSQQPVSNVYTYNFANVSIEDVGRREMSNTAAICTAPASELSG